MLVSPTEPAPLRALGKTSPRPECFGVDYLFPAYGLGPVGVQRKETGDLLASVYDGRLGRELAQMAGLGIKVLLCEGETHWTTDGFLVSTSRRWTRSQHDGLLWSVQLHGCWLAQTSDMGDTAEWLERFGRWLLKKGHNGVLTRTSPKPGMWGTRESKEWGIHVLMGIEGMGYELAERVWEEYGLPLRWTIGRDEFMAVEGIGPKKADRFLEALGG
jgi:ERCC4-type nuclease